MSGKSGHSGGGGHKASGGGGPEKMIFEVIAYTTLAALGLIVVGLFSLFGIKGGGRHSGGSHH